MKVGLFISIPKCATNTIREMFELGPNRDNDNTSHPIIYENHQRLDVLEKKYNLDDVYIFTFVRHPFDRIKSWYYFHKGKFPEYKLPLNEWIKDGCKTHWKIQNETNWKELNLSPLLQFNFINQNRDIHFCKIENFEQDCNILIKKLNNIFKKKQIKKIIKYNYIKLNKSTIQKDDLNDESKEIIFDLFKKDFEYFNYSKYPKMRKVISYSLYGSNKKYCLGMLENLKINKEKLPTWDTYIYYSNDVPNEYIEMYKEFNPILINCGLLEYGWEGMFWRFKLLNDNNVDVFLSRDADSRITDREIEFVNDFIKSDKSFHIIRDHPGHRIQILGGTFGVKVKEFNKKYKIKNIDKYVNEYKNIYSEKLKRNVDQYFLRENIWPLVKNDNYCHIATENLRRSENDILTGMVHNFIGKDVNVE